VIKRSWQDGKSEKYDVRGEGSRKNTGVRIQNTVDRRQEVAGRWGYAVERGRGKLTVTSNNELESCNL
jgi:hypothetical protein